MSQSSISQLQMEMKAHRNAAGWCDEQIAHLKEQKRLANQKCWQIKLKLKQLTETTDAK